MLSSMHGRLTGLLPNFADHVIEQVTLQLSCAHLVDRSHEANDLH